MVNNRPQTLIRPNVRDGSFATELVKVDAGCVYRKPHPAIISILPGKISCSSARIPDSGMALHPYLVISWGVGQHIVRRRSK
jgi:hypothetical protein